MNRVKFVSFCAVVFSFCAQCVYADSVVINNNANNSNGNGNPCQNSAADNSGPPAGEYTTRTSKGTNEIYTTGNNTPVFNDPCNSGYAAPQPQVLIPYGKGGGRR